MEFFDIGAVVWILRTCVWWVPDFSFSVYRDKLLELDGLIRSGGVFVAHSTRHLSRRNAAERHEPEQPRPR